MGDSRENSIDWFFSFILCAVINYLGERWTIRLTLSTFEDRQSFMQDSSQSLGQIFWREWLTISIVDPNFYRARRETDHLGQEKQKSYVVRSVVDTTLLQKSSSIEVILDKLKNFFA